jgi:hypothetical protein
MMTVISTGNAVHCLELDAYVVPLPTQPHVHCQRFSIKSTLFLS